MSAVAALHIWRRRLRGGRPGSRSSNGTPLPLSDRSRHTPAPPCRRPRWTSVRRVVDKPPASASPTRCERPPCWATSLGDAPPLVEQRSVHPAVGRRIPCPFLLFSIPPGDVARRRRCPGITPADRRETRGCATPPTVEEIIAVMRQAGRIATAPGYGQCSSCSGAAGCASRRRSPSPSATSIECRGSLLVRSGKGGRRREIGIDVWGWEQLRPWLVSRLELPIGSLFCIIDGPTRGRPWSSAAVRVELRRLAAQASVRRRFAPHQLRDAHALELAREGIALNII